MLTDIGHALRQAGVKVLAFAEHAVADEVERHSPHPDVPGKPRVLEQCCGDRRVVHVGFEPAHVEAEL